MRKHLLFFLLFFNALYAEEEVKPPRMTSECDTLAIIEGVVNAFNGKLIQVDHDIEILGSEPLEMVRFYDGGHNFESEFGYGVGCSHPAILRLFENGKGYYASVEMRMGCEALFELKRDKTKGKHYATGTVAKETYKLGYTNCCESLLRGEPPIYAMRVEVNNDRAIVSLGNGTQRHYEYWRFFYDRGTDFLLKMEEKSNGNKVHYDYDYTKHGAFYLKRIWTTNSDETLTFNSIDFFFKDNQLTATASNGQKVTYIQKKLKGTAKRGNWASGSKQKFEEYILHQVHQEGYPATEYKQLSRSHFSDTIFSVSKIMQPQGQFLEVDYNSEEKVKRLYRSGISSPIYTFDYHDSYTNVTDARGAHKKFEFERRRLTKMTESHRSQTFTWDTKGQLTRHTVANPAGQKIYERSYVYDERGNILEMKLQGCLTQKGVEDTLVTRYTYDKDSNRIRTENHDDRIEYVYNYYQQTGLLASKLTKFDQKIQEREFYIYDKNGILVHKTVDDGSQGDPNNLEAVTYRQITEIEPQLNPALSGITLPKVIREVYQDLNTGKRYYYKKRELNYTKGDLLQEEKVYDSLGVYQYSLHNEYNSRRELIGETNALGEWTHYAYDDSGNKVFEEKAGKKVYFVYDLANRLIQEKKEHEGRLLITSYEYDLMGNKISVTDSYGQKTLYTYDLANREIAVTDPFGYKEMKEYDVQGNVISFTDKEGHITKTAYNVNNQPVEILHPDGSSQKYAYNRLGNLIQEWQRDGTSTSYTVDYKGRVLEAKTYGSDGTLLKTLGYVYKGDHLIKEIDALGSVTEYQYNDLGRQIAKIEGEIKTSYQYDTLGRITRTKAGDRVDVQLFDFLDRVIEERIEDAQGNIYHKVQYAYDLSGNRTLKREYSDANHYAETQTSYNSQNFPTSETDALGFVTKYAYKQTNHLEKETLDPTGQRRVEIYDPLHRLKETKIYSPQGQLLAYSQLTYDGRGNKIAHEETVLLDGKMQHTYHISTAYDSMSQKIRDTEEGSKITEYTYIQGRLHTLKLPEGILITHYYDPLGRLAQQTASDGTIHYRFTYDLNNNLLQAEDLIHDTVTLRTYDTNNRLVYERQATGQEVYYTYDTQNRPLQVSFDSTTLTYTYSPKGLLSASCHDYTYSQQLDWRGKILQSTLPNEFTVFYEWDAIGQCRSIASPFYNHTLTYDAIGNLMQSDLDDGTPRQERFHYDGLHQLIQESGLHDNTYQFDSIGNRRHKNESAHSYDTLNRLAHDSQQSYSHNLNGHRIAKGEARYTYDALGRLTSFLEGDTQISYSYDPIGRRISRSTPYSTVHYLYQGQVEVGAIENNRLTEFRLTHKHATLAIELNGDLYSLICNHRGDICQLLNSEGVVACYRYDAFGLFAYSGKIDSPWLFSGQRWDAAIQLYHYEKRDYDPHVGQWLTPDPLGFADGPNLYAYVHNNPLVYVDPYGLWREDVRDFLHGSSRGFADDTSWNVTSYALGSYEHKTAAGKWGYRLGTATSMAAGLIYGGTQLRLLKNIASTTCKKLPKFFKSTRSLSETHKITKATTQNTPVKQVFEQNVKSAEKKKVNETFKEFVPAESPVGKKGWEIKNPSYQSTRNNPVTINGREYSSHAIDQMQNRGVFPSLVENAINNGNMKIGKEIGTHAYYDSINNITVIVNSNSGKVVTTSMGQIK